jgi:FkbM family methyltransferase
MASGRTGTIDEFSNNRSTDYGVKPLYWLDINTPEDSRLINFHQLEHYQGTTFRWSEPVSMIRISLPPANCRVEIDTACLRGEGLEFPFQIHWNNFLIPKKAIQINQGMISFSIPARLCEPTGEQRLSIASKPLNAENGRRKLGLPICSVRILAEQHHDHLIPIDAYRKQRQPGSKSGILAKVLGKNLQEPVIPIWQIRFPESSGRLAPSNNSGNLSNFDGQQDDSRNFPASDRVIVSACEINARHGTGLLIQYMFDNFESLATVNSYHCYNGDRVPSKVHHSLIDYDKLQRHEIYDQIYDWFGQAPPQQAYVVPYFKSDFLMAMALKDLFQTRICLHVMDDNCLYGDIPREITQEAIDKSDLLLVISPEMRQHYEQSFGRKAYLLPPVVPDQHIPQAIIAPPVSASPTSHRQSTGKRLWQKLQSLFTAAEGGQQAPAESERGILIGNIWDNSWLELLRKTIRESGLQVDWYSNNPNAVWLQGSQEELARDGIHVHGSLWGEDLIQELRRRSFAIMPSGLLAGEGCKESIARLSLPSRIPFVIATAHLPVIALGSAETAASRFVSRFGLGTTVDYNGQQLKSAVQQILQPGQQAGIRERACRISGSFSAASLQDWIWGSLQKQMPMDDRFENLFRPQQGDYCWFFDDQPPQQIHWSFGDTWRMLNRISKQGFRPEIILDVGSSSGNWSWTAASIFPDARYVLVDPMMSRYDRAERDHYLKDLKSFELAELALSDHCGRTKILVSNDLYGTSLLKVNEETRSTEVAEVEVLTLDQLARQKQLRGRTLLKIDVQFAEHLVILGGLNFIRENVDFLVLELTIAREHPNARTYREMLEMVEGLGFVMIDEMEGWRNPHTGLLEQKDTVFASRSFLQRMASPATRAA